MQENNGLPGRIPILMNNPVQSPSFGILGRSLTDNSNPWSTYSWNCNFQNDFCNLKNAYHLAQFQRYSNPISQMFGQSSMLFINVSDAREYPAARLRSNYFPTNYQRACLSLKYLMYGTGPLKMYVIQQDIENKCIWADFNEAQDHFGQWRETQMTINLRDGSPRFFIETHFDGRPPRYGTVAISSFIVSYGECIGVDNTNDCQRKDEQPIPPEPTPVK